MSRNISYDESTEFTCLHDIQYREYDESADNVDTDNEGTDQRKTGESNDSQMDEAPVNDSSTSVESVEPTSTNDSQALNLTTSTSTSSVRQKKHEILYTNIFVPMT